MNQYLQYQYYIKQLAYQRYNMQLPNKNIQKKEVLAQPSINIVNNKSNQINVPRLNHSIISNQTILSKLKIEKPNDSELENYSLIKEKNNELMKTLLTFKDKTQLLNYLNSLKDIYTFNSEHTLSDKVTLIEGYIVKKKCQHSSFGNFVFWNEVKALHKLRNYPHFPYIYAYDQNRLTIYMSYCGKLISKDNLPTNWKEQFMEISEILKTLNVNSNDMLLRNMCCLNGEIKIIDFGLSTRFGKTIEEVLSDLFSNLNTLSHGVHNNLHNNVKTNHTNIYNYVNEYPNWKNDLEKYKLKEAQIKLLREQLLIKHKSNLYKKK
jgi:tRNA A-37 threonylcarbamoyl transferase component Bud32